MHVHVFAHTVVFMCIVLPQCCLCCCLKGLFASEGSVTTDARAKFTSAKVMYIKQVLGKVTDVTYIFVLALEKLSQTLIAFLSVVGS